MHLLQLLLDPCGAAALGHATPLVYPYPQRAPAEDKGLKYLSENLPLAMHRAWVPSESIPASGTEGSSVGEGTCGALALYVGDLAELEALVKGKAQPLPLLVHCTGREEPQACRASSDSHNTCEFEACACTAVVYTIKATDAATHLLESCRWRLPTSAAAGYACLLLRPFEQEHH